MLIYTSGSTGRPKGVMMTHRNIDAAAESITTYLRNEPDDIILNVLPLAFDYGLYQLLMAMREARLKNDALNETFYELVGEHYQSVGKDYAVFLFHGTYDVPLKASDKESLWESEEVYDFLVCTISPLEGEYEPGEPEWGFLFPAFSDRSTEIHRIDIFQKNATASQTELMKKLFP